MFIEDHMRLLRSGYSVFNVSVEDFGGNYGYLWVDVEIKSKNGFIPVENNLIYQKQKGKIMKNSDKTEEVVNTKSKTTIRISLPFEEVRDGSILICKFMGWKYEFVQAQNTGDEILDMYMSISNEAGEFRYDMCDVFVCDLDIWFYFIQPKLKEKNLLKDWYSQMVIISEGMNAVDCLEASAELRFRGLVDLVEKIVAVNK